ncbi:MAG: AbiV family abortive infection protein [Bacteroidota bacterium]
MNNTNLNEDFYKTGYTLCMESAKALFGVSNKSAELREYGIARSLNILAAEEAVKGISILTNILEPETKLDGWKEIFKSHTVKHDSIAIFVCLMDYSARHIEELVASQKHHFDLIETLPKEVKDKLMEGLKPLLDELEWSKKQKEKGLILQNALIWWKNDANREKNNGFYVGENNNIWHDPRGYSKEQYESERNYTQTFIENAERFAITINSPQLRELLKTEKANSLKDI